MPSNTLRKGGVAVRMMLGVLVLVLVLRCNNSSSSSTDGTTTTSGELVCDIMDHGAKCDNQTDDSAAIQQVLDNTRCTVVRVPAPYNCVSRALNISHMSWRTLRIESGAQLILWRDVSSYADNTGGTTFSFLAAAHNGTDKWHGPSTPPLVC
jgi:polygalacturonase